MARRKRRKSRALTKRRRRKPKQRIPRLLGYSYVTRMRDVVGFNLDPGAGALTSRVFSANGVTFTDITGGGSQPTGFDQFNAFFENYKVLESKCTMQWVPAVSTNVLPGVYGVYQDNDSTLQYSNYQAILEGNQNQSRNIRIAGLINGDAKMKKTSSKYKPSRKLKYGGPKVNTDTYGDSLANPLETQFFQCWYGSPDVSSNPGSSHFIVIMEYVVLWTNRTFMIDSTSPV